MQRRKGTVKIKVKEAEGSTAKGRKTTETTVYGGAVDCFICRRNLAPCKRCAYLNARYPKLTVFLHLLMWWHCKQCDLRVAGECVGHAGPGEVDEIGGKYEI